MSWQTEYPTLEMVNSAAFDTLHTWKESLPPPQTDVERTIHRRIGKQLFARAGEQVREKSPEVADQWNSIMQKFQKLTGVNPPRM